MASIYHGRLTRVFNLAGDPTDVSAGRRGRSRDIGNPGWHMTDGLYSETAETVEAPGKQWLTPNSVGFFKSTVP